MKYYIALRYFPTEEDYMIFRNFFLGCNTRSGLKNMTVSFVI